MKILIRTEIFDRNYLINISNFKYDSLLELILELFSKHQFIDKEIELYLYNLLRESNYTSIDQIPIQQLDSILDYFLDNRDQFKVDYDAERLTYLMLAAIQSKKIIFTIDNQRIENLKEPILLKKESIINFFKLDKLNTINFKMI
jgi:hypothetical protein